MTSWYAIGVGLAVAIVAGVVGTVVPGLGQIGAVVVGGAAAGYLVGDVRGGLWHGFLTGALPALAASAVFAFTIVVADFALEPLGAMLGAVGLDSLGSVFAVSAFGLILAVGIAFFGVAGGVGGLVGGALGRE